MIPLYIATERFWPSSGERWTDYIKRSGLRQLKEVVSLDGLLCPRVLNEIKDEYWPHIVNEDFMLSYFTNLEFMLNQVTVSAETNILCTFKNPSTHPIPCHNILPFEFVGYDLLDTETAISALSNGLCFEQAFADHELNGFGLLDRHERATEVQASLLRHYPDDCHAMCDVWALFRASRF